MTKASQLHLFSLKEKPAEAEIISHQLMLRAGLMHQVTSGLYSWLPLGLKVLKKVEKIVCEEMEAIGCSQILLPGVQPAELWQESGRWHDYGAELLRFQDRHNREYCLAPTHEEVITDLVRQKVRSYRELPLSFFQVQTKFRDEIRPRFGIMRSREFIMKDAYSFHTDKESLEKTYQDMSVAYHAIFTRIGFSYRSVSADSGSIGGDVSREFHVLAGSGEDGLAIASEGDYAANVEMVPCLKPKSLEPPEALEQLEKVATPKANTINALCKQLNLEIEKTIKVLVVHACDSTAEKTKLIGIIVRGDHRLNEIKAQSHPAVLSPLKFAEDKELADNNLTVGFLGPVNTTIDYICDYSAAVLSDFVCGANEWDTHYTGVNWKRDCNYKDAADLRDVCAGDPSPDGNGSIEIHRGIEIGHIFQLGTKYSKAMSATVKDENNQDILMHMGCYGIGVSRIVAAFIEQQHDDKGIVWAPSIAPFHVHIIALRYQDSEQVKGAADSIYQQLKGVGIDVMLDDRNLRAGILFSQADLYGMPIQLVISERNLAQGSVELVERANNEKTLCSLEQLAGTIRSILSL